MPAKLDRCVKEVTKQFMKKGYDRKEAESRAWAVCKASQKMKSKK